MITYLQKTDRLMPVVTIVIYYGEKVWDAATSLHGILNIPTELTPYVNDYRMLLVEARQNNLYFHNGNNQDLFNLFGILLDQNKTKRDRKAKAIEYTKEHEVSDTILKTVAGAANCIIDFDVLKQEGGNSMWSVFEETAKEGEARGEVRGEARGIIDTCHDFGLPDEDILKKLQDKMNISLQTAQEYLRMFEKEMV